MGLLQQVQLLLPPAAISSKLNWRRCRSLSSGRRLSRSPMGARRYVCGMSSISFSKSTAILIFPGRSKLSWIRPFWLEFRCHRMHQRFQSSCPSLRFSKKRSQHRRGPLQSSRSSHRVPKLASQSTQIEKSTKLSLKLLPHLRSTSSVATMR